MTQFPMFKLATLLARQASAPLAARIKEYARTRPSSRRMCMTVGRGYHAAELRFRMWTLALRQPRAIPPLADSAALDTGANLLGEAVVFGLGSLIIIFEVNRQANKQEAKELDAQSQWLAILVQLEELGRELALQQQDMERCAAELRRLAPAIFPPPVPASSTSSAPTTLPSQAQFPTPPDLDKQDNRSCSR